LGIKKAEIDKMFGRLRALLAICALWVAAVSVVSAADTTGNFWRGGGAGGVACPQFVGTMERARSLGIGSLAYTREIQGFMMYVLGFRTGYNMAADATCDIFNGEAGDLYELLAWPEQWCRDNPTSRFSEAVVALAAESHGKRMKECNN
jgi:hypothetical protein